MPKFTRPNPTDYGGKRGYENWLGVHQFVIEPSAAVLRHILPRLTGPPRNDATFHQGVSCSVLGLIDHLGYEMNGLPVDDIPADQWVCVQCGHSDWLIPEEELIIAACPKFNKEETGRRFEKKNGHCDHGFLICIACVYNQPCTFSYRTLSSMMPSFFCVYPPGVSMLENKGLAQQLAHCKHGIKKRAKAWREGPMLVSLDAAPSRPIDEDQLAAEVIACSDGPPSAIDDDHPRISNSCGG